MSSEVAQVIDQVSRWPRDQRLELARSLNRLTAMERLREIAKGIRRRAMAHPLSDEEIDQAVREVRKERPLHQR